ncbi:schlafen family member 13-like [Pecten maximus]|uniref:schlafen family member 13-like n=1 Tax=Pecten maximus TaxID=6579 RepID=UPI0014580D96|nr:schlafen family member 13-like [Pecten maximus]
MTKEKLSEYLRSVTVMASVFPSPLHNRIGTKLLNIATQEQFDFIWEEPYKSCRLLIKGFPGTGKTIIAHQLIRKLFNNGAKQEEILYLTPHVTSRSQAEKKKCCVALTPEALERDMANPTRKILYQAIKHIIVDDAQLICASKEPGDTKWFFFLEDLWKKRRRSNNDSIFWMFYGEHTYRISDTRNMEIFHEHFEQERELQKIIRNSHKIARFAARYSENQKYKDAVDDIMSVHGFEGQAVVCKEVPLSNDAQRVQAVGEFLNEVLLEGYNLEDVAILFSRKNDIPSILNCISSKAEYSWISKENLKSKTITTTKSAELPEVGNVQICSGSDNDITGQVVVDTIRRYSGLDRPVVLAVNPFVADYDRYTSINDLYLIIATRPIAKLEVYSNKAK